MDSRLMKEPQWKNCRTLSGRPASANIRATCSTTVGVCGDGLRMTALPDKRAGIKELTRMRYGYCNDQYLCQPSKFAHTFQANRTSTTPTGSRLIYLLKPFSVSPGTSESMISEAILFKYSPLLTAVATSFAV